MRVSGRVVALLGLLVMLLAAAACRPQESGGEGAGATGARGLTAVPLAPPSASAAGLLRALTPAETGFDYVNDVNDPKVLLDQVAAQAGGAAGDYDNDGDIDFFICGLEKPNRLYRNDGAMKFTDVTVESGTDADQAQGASCGAVFCDLDGDQDLDLFVCRRTADSLLYINDGSGRFSEEARERGATQGYASIMAVPFDVENDGDLDMYICNYAPARQPDGVQEEDRLEFTMGYQPKTGKFILPPEMQDKYYVDGGGKLRTKPDPDELLINDGSGRFVNRLEEAGMVDEHNGWTLQALPVDFNNDGLQDLHVSSDFDTADRWFINQGGGKFRDEAAARLRVTCNFSMGSDAGDLNGDGWMDLFVGDMLPTNEKDVIKQSGDMKTFRYELTHLVPQQQMRNTAYLNRGDGWMSECAEMLNIQATDWTWTVRISDLNCDGMLDIYASNGFVSRTVEIDYVKQLWQMQQAGVSEEERVRLIREVGPLATDDVIFTATEPLDFSRAPGNWGMQDAAVSCGVLLEDFDGDGDQDFVSNNVNSPSVIWRNDVADGNRVVISLRSNSANTQGVGARVTAWCGETRYTTDVILSRGWASGCTGDLYIGLGSVAQIDRLEVRWPDLTLQVLGELPANFRYTISQSKKLPKWQPEARPAALFAQQAFDWEQKERLTTDTSEAPGMPAEFQAEQLLPAQRSQLGTGCGVSDLDGDGNLDVYFGGAAGQAGALFKGDGQGGFAAQSLPADLVPADVEEMGVLAFDPNSDGRPDLLIAAGGNESPPNDTNYFPRLLANTDGTAAGLKAFLPEGLKGWSAGSAAAADLDGDGDLELLICGRQWPFAYMKPAMTRIYEEVSKGKYTDATAKYNKDIERIGVVADGQFVDLNGDGSQDLVLALEMGPLAAFFNQDSKLVRGADIADNGMWQSIGAGDFDNDGDIDLLGGNIGWNTKYHPKDGKPMTLVCDDFDKNGVRDLVEVKWRDDGCALPGRGRSCSGYAIEYIPQKWPTWSSFADATFEDIYGKVDDAAERYDARVLRSQVLINDGTGKFTGSNLPVDVQLAIAQGIGVGDFDCDGNLDAYVAQNFHWPQPETGRWISGYGVLLHGKGDGTFEALSMARSGINFHQDGRGVVACDVNNDGCLDIIFSASNSSPQLCVFDKAQAKGSGLSVSLKGKAPNMQAAGAKLTLELSDGRKLTRVVQAGSGLLSSYYGPQHFGIPEGASAVKLTVTWPDGTSKEVSELAGPSISVEQ